MKYLHSFKKYLQKWRFLFLFCNIKLWCLLKGIPSSMGASVENSKTQEYLWKMFKGVPDQHKTTPGKSIMKPSLLISGKLLYPKRTTFHLLLDQHKHSTFKMRTFCSYYMNSTILNMNYGWWFNHCVSLTGSWLPLLGVNNLTWPYTAEIVPFIMRV